MARCERLRGAALRDVLGRTQGVLFDCDGVLWNGERAVPGAPELLERLARAGKAALFVSNNSRRARPELALRFARLGFGGLRAEQLFSSALCAARLLRQRLLGPPEVPGAVFVLGGEGLRAELRAAGLRLAGDPGEDSGAAPRVRAVLVGYDEHFSFAKLSEACAHLRDPDCLLVATDRDPWHPLSDGSRTPGRRVGNKAWKDCPPVERLEHHWPRQIVAGSYCPVSQIKKLRLREGKRAAQEQEDLNLALVATPAPTPAPSKALFAAVIWMFRPAEEAGAGGGSYILEGLNQSRADGGRS
ncbi:chronophin isoform X4 [Panthera tigris]|uniref:chronophin isoform X4 n=1 Tax=Panthera tigris TaxID=9694 RepID=UPI001C6F7AEB|nr:chronophin isoform X4 [Panthera tigris]